VSYTLPQTSELLQAPADKILRLVEAGKVIPMRVGDDYFFSAEDLTALGSLLGSRGTRGASSQTVQPAMPSPEAEFYSVAELAALWRLSRDTIQRLFEEEPGVITLGDKNPRGRRKRVTLRIPRDVAERVQKRRSNP
jgi:hypothetical protein